MPDFSKISSSVIISAMGQAFFTLSLGMGAIMAYGAYIPEEQNLTKTVSLIIFLDTFVAIIAGVIIFRLYLLIQSLLQPLVRHYFLRLYLWLFMVFLQFFCFSSVFYSCFVSCLEFVCILN